MIVKEDKFEKNEDFETKEISIEGNGHLSLDRVITQIGFLLNSIDPVKEINKLISLELTVNSKAKDLSYQDVMNLVVIRLANFYGDEDLRALWTEYLLIDNGTLSDEDLKKVA